MFNFKKNTIIGISLISITIVGIFAIIGGILLDANEESQVISDAEIEHQEYFRIIDEAVETNDISLCENLPKPRNTSTFSGYGDIWGWYPPQKDWIYYCAALVLDDFTLCNRIAYTNNVKPDLARQCKSILKNNFTFGLESTSTDKDYPTKTRFRILFGTVQDNSCENDQLSDLETIPRKKMIDFFYNDYVILLASVLNKNMDPRVSLDSPYVVAEEIITSPHSIYNRYSILECLGEKSLSLPMINSFEEKTKILLILDANENGRQGYDIEQYFVIENDEDLNNIIPPPKIQNQMNEIGEARTNFICDHGLIPIENPKGGFSCVTNDTYKKLIFRGWVYQEKISSKTINENHIPLLKIISPKDGDSFKITTPIRWKSFDLDGDSLSHTIEIKINGTKKWITLEKNFQQTTMENKLLPQYAIKSAQIKITVNDGTNELSLVSGNFSVNLETGRDITKNNFKWKPGEKNWQGFVVDDSLLGP
jgi:hypothetical protein